MRENTLTLMKKIRSIQVLTTHLASDILAGAYRSAFKGKGMEFEEVREYQPGDDVRSIDWNVTARMNHPYVKNFREERQQTLTLLVDISPSTFFGSIDRAKNELIAEISAVLAFSAIKNHDKVALILFSDRIEKYIPAKSGTGHILRVIRELLVTIPQGRATNVGLGLSFLGKISIHSGICFLISDFICPDFSKQAAMIARRHDLIALAVVDPSESVFPKMGIATLSDLETEQTCFVDTNDESFQDNLASQTKERLLIQHRLMDKLGSGFLEIHTEKPYFPQLRKFFLNRQKRSL